MNGKIYLK